MSSPRHPVIAVTVAVLGVLLLGSAANYVVVGLWPGFVLVDTGDTGHITTQVSLFYATRIASQLPAMCFAGFVFAVAAVGRHCLFALVSVGVVEAVLFVFRVVVGSWLAFPAPGPTVAIVWEVTWVVAVSFGALGFAWVWAKLLHPKGARIEPVAG